MKANEAATMSKEKREQLIKEQLRNIHQLIHTTAERGCLDVWTHSTDYTSSLHTGFLDEVVDKLRTEGYSVSMGGTRSTLNIRWGDEMQIEDELPQLPNPPSDRLIKEGAVGRPVRMPNLITEDVGGIVPMVIAGLVIVGLILSALIFLN